MTENIRDLLNPTDLAEAKQEGLRKKIEDQRININELPQLPEGAIDAIRIAGMELKIKVTELLKQLETLNNKDPRYVDIKKEIANKVQVMQSWKSSFGSFQQAKQEFFQNLFSYSKANNQLKWKYVQPETGKLSGMSALEGKYVRAPFYDDLFETTVQFLNTNKIGMVYKYGVLAPKAISQITKTILSISLRSIVIIFL